MKYCLSLVIDQDYPAIRVLTVNMLRRKKPRPEYSLEIFIVYEGRSDATTPNLDRWRGEARRENKIYHILLIY